MFSTFTVTPKTFAFATVCLGIGVWMSTTSVASKSFEFEVDNRKHAPVISPTMPNDLTLFGEPVPLQNFGVREALDRELVVNTYRHSSTILYLKRASRWFPLIEPILEEEGVPADFKYLAVIESGLSQVVSPSGASGFWQFMKRTAPEYGLEVSSTVDERYHVEKATRAACAYLKDAHAKFGSWVLAAASYNMGRAGVANALASQHVTTYWDLHLNSETARYVYRLLALREVMDRPEGYGFHLGKSDVYAPLESRIVEVSKSIPSLTEFALGEGTTLRELKAINPWMRSSSLSVPSGKTYQVRIPL